jgi:hypothetical protein
MRTKYFIAYTWHNYGGSGSGRCHVNLINTIATSDDLAEVERMISELPSHAGKATRIVVTNWQRFEPRIRDREITRKALSRGKWGI